jgi:cytochrome c biogenesis protein CcmG/thiol:disulfide interchange protein DsbE
MPGGSRYRRPTMSRRRRAVALVSVLAGVLLGACSGGDGHAVGADRVDLSKLQVVEADGTETSLARYERKPLVMNFFASWCVPCKTELPAIESVHRTLGDKVTFVGVDTKDIADDGAAMVDAANLTYDIVSDPKGNVITAVAGVGMPTTLLVDPDGKIVASHTGALTASELTSLIHDKLPG